MGYSPWGAKSQTRLSDLTSSTRSQVYLPFEPAVRFLRIHYSNLLAHRQNNVRGRLIISLFALAKDWGKKSKCPSLDNWLSTS